MIKDIKIEYVEAKKYSDISDLKMFQVQNQPRLLELNKESDLSLKVSFECSIDYSPGVGYIYFKGFLIYTTASNKATEQLIDQWRHKKLDQNTVYQWLGAIFQTCLIRSVAISEIVGLPIAIPLPNMTQGKAVPAKATKRTSNKK